MRSNFAFSFFTASSPEVPSIAWVKVYPPFLKQSSKNACTERESSIESIFILAFSLIRFTAHLNEPCFELLQTSDFIVGFQIIHRLGHTKHYAAFLILNHNASSLSFDLLRS